MRCSAGRIWRRLGSPASPSTFRSRRERALSFLRFTTPAADASALPAEIAFLVAEGVPVDHLARAARLARDGGTDAATALLHAGLMEEEAYYRALARALRVPFLDGPMPFGPGLQFPDSLVTGLAPLVSGAPAPCVLAPRGPQVAELLAGYGPAARMPAITTPTRLREAVFSARPGEIAAHAADTLRLRAPHWASPREPASRWLLFLGLCLCAGIGLFSALPPAPALALTLAAQVVFLTMTVFRTAALSIGAPAEAPPAVPLPDRDLPTYTVLVALYREAAVVPRIVRALAGLDYPAAKLDLKFVIEAGDRETAEALARVPFPARFEIVVAPPGEPRTKPRALNVALPLARGSHLVVFDAEDVPDPAQLRRAAEVFSRSPQSLACLQGRLVIDNPADSLLARLFALEYTGLFDVLNPALARWALPIPLGGTSTHFRTRVLRDLHGWDAWNVTEDADLGIRLALAGYRVGDLPSHTLEEAPITVRAWLHQRTRWMKGFLQTSLTHGRRPIATLRDLGWLPALCAVTMVPGTVVSALVYPVCFALALNGFVLNALPAAPDFLSNLPTGLALTLFAMGLAALALPAALGCLRRGWRDLLWLVLLLPAYFGLISLAAWLALLELVRAPDRWNKTEHGLSRTSRSGLLRSRRPAPPQATSAAPASPSSVR
nr:glycosyltransferase family 2 protein [Methylobacterium trifolii]